MVDSGFLVGLLLPSFDSGVLRSGEANLTIGARDASMRARTALEAFIIAWRLGTRVSLGLCKCCKLFIIIGEWLAASCEHRLFLLGLGCSPELVPFLIKAVKPSVDTHIRREPIAQPAVFRAGKES